MLTSVWVAIAVVLFQNSDMQIFLLQPLLSELLLGLVRQSGNQEANVRQTTVFGDLSSMDTNWERTLLSSVLLAAPQSVARHIMLLRLVNKQPGYYSSGRCFSKDMQPSRRQQRAQPFLNPLFPLAAR